MVRYSVVRLARRAPLVLVIAKGDTVVQVGAVGKGEIWDMLRLVGPSGRVIAVEAAPDNVAEIRERIERESIKNLTVIPKGAWSERTTQTLYMHPRYRGSHIMLDSGARHDRAMDPDNYAQAVNVECEPLDDLLQARGISHVDFIKITVMGAEMQVLRGMDRLLRTTPKLWVKAHALYEGRPANQAISKLLRERGYHTVVVMGNDGPGGRRAGDVYATR